MQPLRSSWLEAAHELMTLLSENKAHKNNPNIGALIITSTILGVPYYNCTNNIAQNPSRIIKAPRLRSRRCCRHFSEQPLALITEADKARS